MQEIKVIAKNRGKQKKNSPATWADHLSNFFVFNLFFKNG